MEEIRIHEILELLPHRYPFLLVDKIVEKTEDSIVGIKNVTMNEPQFMGHFPENPIMPGVLQLEAMAQVGGVLCMEKLKDKGVDINQKVIFFTTIDKVKFKTPVIPGDIMRMEIKIDKFVERKSATIVQMTGVTKNDADKVCSSAELGAWLVDKEKTSA